MKTSKLAFILPQIVKSWRQSIDIYNFGILTAGVILIAILILPFPKKGNLISWILLISWIISMILYTHWRFTGLKQLYKLKVNKQDIRGIRLLVVFEYLIGVFLCCLLLFWIGIHVGSPIGTTLYMATVPPLATSGLFFLIFIVPNGIFKKDILK